MTGELPGFESLVRQVFEPLTREIHAGSLVEEPVERKGKVLIPVNTVSVRGFFSSFSGRTHGPRVKTGRKLIGHIVVGPNDVSWRPRPDPVKLAMAAMLALAFLVAAVKNRA